ncbi:hypothetical protein D8674_026379 [Pyrus ussuriensis x Pyrus communis]|uniref:Uncharacterized protein n=1 Tax=Pyrus ussuriensis x Pyrus communis TaxID=2448454 RepID=A0A5N5I6N5_9ROSA|nr:hypothetical protein D8674_026379 [Pyrus ussuriensis x Pyrus communis]
MVHRCYRHHVPNNFPVPHIHMERVISLLVPNTLDLNHPDSPTCRVFDQPFDMGFTLSCVWTLLPLGSFHVGNLCWAYTSSLTG